MATELISQPLFVKVFMANFLLSDNKDHHACDLITWINIKLHFIASRHFYKSHKFLAVILSQWA